MVKDWGIIKGENRSRGKGTFFCEKFKCHKTSHNFCSPSVAHCEAPCFFRSGFLMKCASKTALDSSKKAYSGSYFRSYIPFEIRKRYLLKNLKLFLLPVELILMSYDLNPQTRRLSIQILVFLFFHLLQRIFIIQKCFLIQVLHFLQKNPLHECVYILHQFKSALNLALNQHWYS